MTRNTRGGESECGTAHVSERERERVASILSHAMANEKVCFILP
jgi:hypothetical protein